MHSVYVFLYSNLDQYLQLWLFTIAMPNLSLILVYILSIVAREACCCLSFTIDSLLSATHLEETHTAGKLFHNTVLSQRIYKIWLSQWKLISGTYGSLTAQSFWAALHSNWNFNKSLNAPTCVSGETNCNTAAVNLLKLVRSFKRTRSPSTRDNIYWIRDDN